MPSATRFNRPCPTCGRNLEIPVDHIGRDVVCSSCHSIFQATPTAEHSDDFFEHALEQRIDRLLNQVASVPRPHFDHAATPESRSYEV